MVLTTAFASAIRMSQLLEKRLERGVLLAIKSVIVIGVVFAKQLFGRMSRSLQL